ncbi:uncharacterized protein LOC122509940 [Leptopilina heterotoma]|uniref:uncharacterized protein LOC122509940 n=1 Tax=Leptopilina heterotoma TaxID=63436 RepID=UPI001CA7BDF7|nr:uncharacterized protein LOC122509940 [Leptopilina heterotoma]XP_043480211.1 uncharacterized protein LOC122509940 [Leptopilina heterotoma]
MTNTAGFGSIGTLLLLLFFLTFLNNGDALTCYQCNSAYDPRCGDPFDSYSLGTVNCSFQPRLEHLKHLEPAVCRKISQKVYGEIRVVRGCGFINDDESDNKECIRRSGTHDVKAFYCSCTTDLCNAAYTTLPSKSIVGALVYLLTMKVIN